MKIFYYFVCTNSECEFTKKKDIEQGPEKFCPRCTAKLAVKCPECHIELENLEPYCSHCKAAIKTITL
jgi:hypothetical protein